MRNLKVWTFHPTSRNALFFMALSIVFLILQQSLQSGLPFLNLAFLRKVLTDEWFVILIAVPALYTTFQQRRSAPRFFAVYAAAVAFRSLEGLFLDFNKLVLVVLFFHIVISYAFYQLLTWTFARAAFSPNYTDDALHTPMGRTIPAEVSFSSKVIQGRLTNWDKEGAFIWLENELDKNAREVAVKVSWENHTFEAKGSVVSGTWDGKGIGIEWEHAPITTEDSWTNLMILFGDYGYDPKLLR